VVRKRCFALAMVVIITTAGGVRGSGPDTVRSCESLATETFGDGSRVTSAVVVPAAGATPEYCEVKLVVPEQINVIVGLPTTTWNGRYLALGGGGMNGFLAPPLAAVAANYAGSSTDTGHVGNLLSAEWAWSPTGLNTALIDDFAYRANHEMAVKAKALISLFYGRAPAFSYWNGCSTGGREGLTEAMRFPEDFDGIVAASPAINWTRFVPAGMWPPVVMHARRNYLPLCKEVAATAAVRRACDGTADGAKDGLMDARVCRFSPRKLVGLPTPCGALTKADVAVLQQLWRGPRRANGTFLWYGLEPGTDLGSVPSLTLAATVSSPAGSAVASDAMPFSIVEQWLRFFIHEDPTWDWHSETPDQFTRDFDTSVTRWRDVLATDDPDLSGFRARGGKTIIWHGLADQLIFPRGTIHYYKHVVARNGGLRRTAEFARLFLPPNSPHCLTGREGPYPVDPLSAVVEWREEGVAPATLEGAGTTPAGQTLARNLCPYPQRMAYTGAGDVLAAESFMCRGPSLSARR
jgi:hypothetical protein